jgi:hypothetical protein
MSTSVTSHQLDVPGASIYYEVRGSGLLLALIGAPMGRVWVRCPCRSDGFAVHRRHL